MVGRIGPESITPKSEMAKYNSRTVPSEETNEAVHIAVDEVGAKKQQEHREKKPQDSPAEPKRKDVQDTVIHREKEGAFSLLHG